MWLKISYPSSGSDRDLATPSPFNVELIDQDVAPIDGDDHFVRISPIFPLDLNLEPVKDVRNCSIIFFEFSQAFRVLARILHSEFDDLKRRTYFSCGSCSVIIVSDRSEVLESFYSLGLRDPNSCEVWQVAEGQVEKPEARLNGRRLGQVPIITDYAALPCDLQSILDEFAMSVRVIAERITNEDSYERTRSLISEINGFIEELKALTAPDGVPPADVYYAGDPERLKDPLERVILAHQVIDRIIQINSTLSYISTQLFSGSIPILERRSLIRRNSLLGVGSGIRALNETVDFFESIFESANIPDIIKTSMQTAARLPGLDVPALPKRTDWHLSNVDRFGAHEPGKARVPKLAYFSSRYGFRETEYSVTAAMNSLSNGLSLGWSLLTITHEMLHSHVRLLLSAIFFDEGRKVEDSFQRFFDSYYKTVVLRQEVQGYSLIDSIRELIFTYCVRTRSQGSLTEAKEFRSEMGFRVKNDFNEFYERFRIEQRNINEILVHVLDLHYFYGGRVAKYVPLIWCSWSCVPHVYADLRQYILRTLLAIASKLNPKDSVDRFDLAVSRLRSILGNSSVLAEQFPIIPRVLTILDNKPLLDLTYYNAFANGLILVDLAHQILFSERIKSRLDDDVLVTIEPSDSDAEDKFSYEMPHEFNEAEIDAPIALLFDRLLRVLSGELNPTQTERDTTMIFLAINSK